jgi:hypothetical protein
MNYDYDVLNDKYVYARVKTLFVSEREREREREREKKS